MIREVQSQIYNSNEHSDHNSLSQLLLSQPDKLNRKLTYLYGAETTKLSFLFMTEAQSGGIKEVNDIQYTFDVMGNFKFHANIVADANSSITKKGLAHSKFQLDFDSNWFPNDWVVMTPSGKLAYIHGMPSEISPNRFRYTFELAGGVTAASYLTDSADYAVGAAWILIAPYVPEGGSRGNKSNRMAPGKMKNQIGFHRFTQKIRGNLANKVVPIVFDGANTTDGGTKSYWINEEHRQFLLQQKTAENISMYTTEYNRKEDGSLVMKYYENNEAIPMSAGIKEMVHDVGNYDTYGYVLTLTKLKNIFSDIFWGATDSGSMEVVMHCGQGFAEDFDDAVNADIQSNKFYFKLAEHKISGKNGYLQYGANSYFRQYTTITGHTLTLKIDDMFDHGILGMKDRLNNNNHPRTGLPMSSHQAIVLDYSVYGGERNIQQVVQKGQKLIQGVVKGLSPIPASWGSVPVNSFASDLDASSFEMKKSAGINIANAKHCFHIECKLD